MTQTVKNLLAMQETWVLSLGQEDPLEKGMASPSSILAWRISGTEELGRLQSWGHKELDTPECLTLCVDLFRLILIETLCASCTWVSVSFPRLGTFSVIISSCEFSALFSLSSPGIPIMQILVFLMLSL